MLGQRKWTKEKKLNVHFMTRQRTDQRDKVHLMTRGSEQSTHTKSSLHVMTRRSEQSTNTHKIHQMTGGSEHSKKKKKTGSPHEYKWTEQQQQQQKYVQLVSRQRTWTKQRNNVQLLGGQSCEDHKVKDTPFTSWLGRRRWWICPRPVPTPSGSHSPPWNALFSKLHNIKHRRKKRL